MKIEVRDIKSIKLIPENDSDRAVLQAFEDMAADKTLLFHIQSYGRIDGRVDDMCIGFSTHPATR